MPTSKKNPMLDKNFIVARSQHYYSIIVLYILADVERKLGNKLIINEDYNIPKLPLKKTFEKIEELIEYIREIEFSKVHKAKVTDTINSLSLIFKEMNHLTVLEHLFFTLHLMQVSKKEMMKYYGMKRSSITFIIANAESFLYKKLPPNSKKFLDNLASYK